MVKVRVGRCMVLDV